MIIKDLWSPATGISDSHIQGVSLFFQNYNSCYFAVSSVACVDIDSLDVGADRDLGIFMMSRYSGITYDYLLC